VPHTPVTNRTLAGSEPARDLIGHVESSGRFPSVLLVLIDDADFGNPGTFGGPIDIPNYTRMGPFGAVPPGRTTVQGIAPRLAGHRPERGGRTPVLSVLPAGAKIRVSGSRVRAGEAIAQRRPPGRP
jgi:hypothetical protein